MARAAGLRPLANGGLGLACTMLAGCLSQSAEVRYRVVVTIKDGEVVRSGSSVWKVAVTKPTVPLASSYDSKFVGEAVAIDLTGGGKFFALLVADNGSDYAPQLPLQLFGDPARVRTGEPRRFQPSDKIKDLQDIARRVGESHSLSCDITPLLCPLFAVVKDVSEARGIVNIDSPNIRSGPLNNVQITEIRVVIVDDEPSDTLKPMLSSMGIVYGNKIDRNFTPTTKPTLAQRIGYSAFRRGLDNGS